MTEYSEIKDPRIQSRVDARYRREIAALQAIGFRHLAYKLERRGPLSAVLQLRTVLLMQRAKEVLVFPFPLRLGAANVLLLNSGPPSIASCMGMGIKFYTRFTEGSILITSTLRSHQGLIGKDAASPIIRNPPHEIPEEAWLSHKRRTAEIESEGKVIQTVGSFADYVEISRLEDLDLRRARMALPNTGDDR